MCLKSLMVAAFFAAAMAARGGDTGVDPAEKHAWGENVGWVNAGPTNQGVTVHYYEGTGGWLSGHAWGENIGWISMGSAGGGPFANNSSSNWGVNVAADGDLSGHAWGENVGWINFGAVQCDAAINPLNGEFSGHAWGENIGWLKFRGASPDYGVRTLAFDTQPLGTPNWWLDFYGVTEGYDAGDGVPAWQKYVMDTHPKVEGDYLRITALSREPTANLVDIFPSSTRRYYTLARCSDLKAGAWSNVVDQTGVAGEGGTQGLKDVDRGDPVYYRVTVTVAP